ncbi:MAG: hypothetical protein HUK22_05930, partial [Thermoguttaceae bacterium]|nr:hypothetical protein [Thermoguttaceae bacterium]
MRSTPMKSFREIFFATSFVIIALFSSATAFGTEAEAKIIDARAKEIAPSLADDYATFANVGDRARWDALAATASGKAKIVRAEDYLKSKAPDLPESLYREYYANGNRTHYQSAYGALQSRIDTFALAEALEMKGRFLEALDVDLKILCAQPSWVLPAHDANAVVYEGKEMYSDLGSTLVGAMAAFAVALHRDSLPAETVELVKSEVERRVLKPYEEEIAAAKVRRGMWWMRGTSNWNAVCLAGTIGAVLAIEPSKERRAKFLAAADYFSETYFLKGFTNDGYCSEGMGYWHYGFGNYIYLGALVRRATNGALDLFRFPIIPAVLHYGPTLEIDGNNFATFADCAMNARPSALYVGYLSRLKNFGYAATERAGLDENFQLGDLMQTLSIGFDAEIVRLGDAAETGAATNSSLPIRTDFPNAGVLICRPNPNATGKYFAIALKGGHNNEMHNHNDVGSYSLIFGDRADKAAPIFVSRDPGGETYTARTFSSRRYEGQLLNSFGHPVPRIAGVLQKAGGDAKGVVTEKSFEDGLDRFAINMTSAYP